LQKLIAVRKEHDAFAGGALEVIPTENEHVLGFVRTHAGKRAVVVANFSESTQTIPRRIFEQYAVHSEHNLYRTNKTQTQKDTATKVSIEPLAFLVFGN
jgi:glycosidase